MRKKKNCLFAHVKADGDELQLNAGFSYLNVLNFVNLAFHLSLPLPGIRK